MTSLLRRSGVAALAGLLAAGGVTTPVQAAAADRGTIQGTFVTDSGAPISDAFVVALDGDGSWLRDTTTDENGRYTLRNVEAGIVKIHFQNNGVRQYAHRQLDEASATLFTLAGGQTLTVDERQLPTGTIAGQVRDPSGEPGSFTVEVTDGPGDHPASAYAFADENGRYSVDVLPGDYKVSFQRDAAEQWAYGKVDEESADVVRVTAGSTTTVDDTLLPTGSLGGRLTTPDGEPLEVAVTLHRGDDTVGYKHTDENGEYAFEYVLPGQYQVSFYDHNSGSGFEQFLPGTVLREQARTFTVTAGQHTVASGSQPRLGTVQGTLIDSAGAPVADRQVTVQLDSETNFMRYEATTGADGSWRVDGVFPARYVVSFTHPESERRQYAYGKSSAEAADRIEVTAGATTTVDDTWLAGATLVVRAVDSVTGAPATKICASVADASECTTGSEVTLSDLAAGDFEVELHPDRGSFYLSSGEHPVTLTAGQTTTVTIPMVQGGKVTATVTDAVTGEPIADTCLTILQIGDGGLGDGGGPCTNAAGVVTTYPLAAGTYTAFASAPDEYGHQWVGATGGTGDQRAAARIVVKPGKVVKAPAIRLDRPGTISGTVTHPDGRPAKDVSVSVTAWDYGVGPGYAVNTDAAGRYSLTGLGPYAWPVLFTEYGYARMWSGGTGNRFQAEAIQVPAGGRASYDFTLQRGTVLTGTVTAPEGVEDWRLTAVNAVTGDPIGVADSDPAQPNRFAMPLAGGQQIKIEWSVSGPDFWRRGWWEDAQDQDSARKVHVPKTGTKTLNLTIG